MSMVDRAKNNVGIILQARMGSTRLPGKVLMPFADTTLLGWILRRLGPLPWPVIVATTTNPHDQPIVEHALACQTECFCGDENDVLDRYWKCMNTYGFQHVIRLTADNPFPDVDELQRLVISHCQQGFDYSHSLGQLPIGVGAEIFSADALTTSWKEGKASSHREHVNEYVLEHPELFRIHKLDIAARKHAPGLGLTIDTLADFRRISEYLLCLDGPAISTEQLIALCSSSV